MAPTQPAPQPGYKSLTIGYNFFLAPRKYCLKPS